MKHQRPKPEHEVPPLTRCQVAELQRRLVDMDDSMRYVIVSSLLPNFSLFYFPADGVFAMNEIPEAALFKRKSKALAVARALELRRRKETGARR